MNNTIQTYSLSRLMGTLSQNNLPHQAAGSGFLDTIERLQAGESKVQSDAKKADLSMEAYKQSILEKISQLSMSSSSRMQSISIQISDEGFAAMKNDPEYESWVLDSLQKDFLFENPWTAICGGGYVVHHFGSTKEEYRGESWYPGYMGGQGASLFEEKSKDSFWEQRIQRQEEFQKLQQEAAAKRRFMLQRMNGGTLSAAALLMDLF